MQPEKAISDEVWLNLIKMIAEKHGCKFMGADFERRIIDLDCPAGNNAECALAIADAIGHQDERRNKPVGRFFTN